MITFLSYIADVWILLTYALMVRHPRFVNWFNWANAGGALPLAILEAQLHAWPAVVITVAFGIIGAVGVWRAHR